MSKAKKKRVVTKGRTYKARKKESRARAVTLELPEQLLGAVLDAPADNPAAIQAALYADLYQGGIDEAKADRFIYAPNRESLTGLPPGILDLKEAMPPLDLIPDRDRLLDAFLRDLILKTGIGDSLPLFTGGWQAHRPGVRQASRFADWHDHVAALFHRKRQPGLYAALVSGRFRPVILHLRRLTTSDPVEVARLKRDLRRQALIWCCHDVQMVIARLAVSDAVFGPLVASIQVKLSPERVRRLLKERRELVEALLDLLYGSPEWRKRDLPLPDLSGESDGSLTRNPLVQDLRQQIEARSAESGMTDADGADEVAVRIGAVAAHLRDGGPDLAATLPITGEEKTLRSMTAVWFGGSSVAMAAVLRLIQAEHQMGTLIDHLVGGNQSALRAGTALPPFDSDTLPGWRTRAIDLLDFYRRTLLRDSDHAPGTTSREAIDTARDFLVEAGQRLIQDHEGDRNDRRRSLYLLDVLPEHRFAIKSMGIT